MSCFVHHLSLCILLIIAQSLAIQIKTYVVNDPPIKDSRVWERPLHSRKSNSTFHSTARGFPLFNSKVAGKSTTLKVIHKYGPHNPKNVTKKLQSEILAMDEARVRQAMKRWGLVVDIAKDSVSVDVPTYSGSAVGGGNYIVGVFVGTPRKTLYLEIDTGSQLPWTQCRPCVQCYPQNSSVFDPSQSSTFSYLPCSSSACSSPVCLNSTCLYDVEYGDGSHTLGTLATEVFNFCGCESQKLDNFVFGCGNENVGLLFGTDGVLGMNRAPLSVISQTEGLYGGVFSYCFPSTDSGTGRLSFGGIGASEGQPMLIPFSRSKLNDRVYAVDLTGIKVGEDQIDFKPAVTMVIDSGTVISRLPRVIYAAVSHVFKKKMARYRQTSGYANLDTCFHVGGLDSLPNIDFYFNNGDLVIELNRNGVYVTKKKVCLAMVAHESDVAILGNHQQRSLDFVFDVPNGKWGLVGLGCD